MDFGHDEVSHIFIAARHTFRENRFSEGVLNEGNRAHSKGKIGLAWDMNISCSYESIRGRKSRNLLDCEDKEGGRRWNFEAETMSPIIFLYKPFTSPLLILFL